MDYELLLFVISEAIQSTSLNDEGILTEDVLSHLALQAKMQVQPEQMWETINNQQIQILRFDLFSIVLDKLKNTKIYTFPQYGNPLASLVLEAMYAISIGRREHQFSQILDEIS